MPAFCDYDLDGNLDFYVGNDFAEPDLLYHNNGDGTFRNVLNEVVPHSTWFSMGVDVGVDNDGRLDFLISEMASTTHFMEKTAQVKTWRRYFSMPTGMETLTCLWSAAALSVKPVIQV